MKADENKFSIQSPLANANKGLDWNKYLDELDLFLCGQGFRKYNQNHKGENFAYWKKYGNEYQIGLLVYDWRKFDAYTNPKKISIMFECMLIDIDGRYDLTVSDEIELRKFEDISFDFNSTIREHL